MDLLQYDPEKLSYSVECREGKILNIDPSLPRVFSNHFAPGSSRWWRKGKRPRRDSFRQRSYDAERAFRNKVEFKTFTNITEVARYVRDLMEKPFFQRRFPLFQECVVEYKPRIRCCSGGPRKLASPPNDNAEVVIGHITMSTGGLRDVGEVAAIHEIAHAILPIDHLHDRRWARTFIELVGCMMGTTCKKILKEEFHNRRVPFSPIRKSNAVERVLFK